MGPCCSLGEGVREAFIGAPAVDAGLLGYTHGGLPPNRKESAQESVKMLLDSAYTS